jgi:CubicO group peptidase (beta-lactamase class C family)
MVERPAARVTGGKVEELQRKKAMIGLWPRATPTICKLGMAFCVVGLSGISVRSKSQEAVQLPDTPSGRLVGDWISVCQAQNLARLKQWFTANLSEQAAKRASAEDRALDDLGLCEANGGFRLAGITKAEAGTLSVLLVGLKSGVWFEERLAANGAGQLDRARLTPTAPAESALPKDLSDDSVAHEVNSTVAKLSGMGLFSGIVTVARGRQILASASAGYADLAKKTPITGSTRFTLGSMGKMFTAAAIGQAVDQGKLSFEDTVGKFFPDYPNQTVRDKVTVGMLLSHTAGLGDFLGKRTPDMMKNGVKRAADFMPLYDTEEPQFVPGSNWAYSNAGLALAGAILEKVSGEDYPDYLRKHIFAVAGMKNSDPNNIPHTTAGMVTPYTKLSERGPSPDWHEAEHDIGSPAGGAISSADDLVRFADALRNGKLVSKATFEEMIKPHGSALTAKYGYAMEIGEIYGRAVVGHGGGFPGVSTRLYLVLDSPYTVVTLANIDPPAAEYAGSKVVAIMAEKAKSGK